VPYFIGFYKTFALFDQTGITVMEQKEQNIAD